MSNYGKHTPAPWSLEVRRGEKWDIDSDSGILVAETYSPNDALLIAAAPDLLEALELIVMERAWYRSERPEGYNIEDRLNAWEETARAAIAKAKGEQQC